MSRVLRQRLASHNRHAWLLAALSLLGAWVSWTVAYGLAAAISLGVLTVIHGQEVVAGERLMSFPPWLQPAFLALALAALVWAAVDERKTRYQPVSDRPLIGWHLLADFLLLPARLTFGVGHQLAGTIRLRPREQEEALEVLRHILEERRCPATSLGAYFPDLRALRRELAALQALGWIDLLRTEEGWIYIGRSSAAEELRGIPGSGAPEEEDPESQLPHIPGGRKI